MKMAIFFKGALTNKPFAFTFRAWELETQKSFNFFDVFCEEILVEFRGLSVVRILPAVKDVLAFNWITDKTRFFFDSLNYQRNVGLVLHINKKEKQSEVRLDWVYILSFFNFWFSKIRQFRQQSVISLLSETSYFFKDIYNQSLSFNIILNSNFNSDLLDLSSFSKVIKRLGGGFISSEGLIALSVDKSNFLNFEQASLKMLFKSLSVFVTSFLLVDVDLRFEVPKLYLLLKSIKKKVKPKVFVVGVRDLGVRTFEFVNLGSTFSAFVRLLQGSSLLTNLFEKEFFVSYNILHWCVVGDNFFQQIKTARLESMFNSFCKRYHFHILHLRSSVSTLNISLFNIRNLRLGFKKYISSIFLTKFNGFFFDMSTSIFNRIAATRSLYCTLNSFLQKLKLDCFLQLPCSTIYERDFLHLNIFGFLKESFKFIRNNGMSTDARIEQRPFFKIFQMFLNLLKLRGVGENFSKGSDFLNFLNLKPVLNVVKKFKFSVINKLVWFFSLVGDFLLNKFVFNFYKIDEFSKNSLVLTVASNLLKFANY